VITKGPKVGGKLQNGQSRARLSKPAFGQGLAESLQALADRAINPRQSGVDLRFGTLGAQKVGEPPWPQSKGTKQ